MSTECRGHDAGGGRRPVRPRDVGCVTEVARSRAGSGEVLVPVVPAAAGDIRRLAHLACMMCGQEKQR